MNQTRLDVSLEQYEVGLSGAVPDRNDWSEPAMDRGILEFVALFSGLVFKYGGRIVHGSHPTFTPIILRQARQHADNRPRKPVTLVMSDLWARDLPEDYVTGVTDVAEFVITRKIGDGGPEDSETRNQSLSGRFRHQLLLPRPYLVLTKPLRLDIQCQRGASVKIGCKYLDD